jgi:hypothetical protein
MVCRRGTAPLRSDRGWTLLLPTVTILLAGGTTVVTAAPVSSSLDSAPGIQVASFQLAAGTIYVNVPDDIGPGDRASGTVNPIPTGAGERDLDRRRKELNRYSIELAGERARASEKVRSFTVPAPSRSVAPAASRGGGAPDPGPRPGRGR